MLGSRLLAIALLASSPEVDSAREQLEIEWDAEQGCDDPEPLQRELRRYRLDDGAATARVRVVLRSDADGRWLVDLHLEFDDGAVDRRFGADSCALATSATALMIAVALDPMGALEQLEVESEQPEPEPELEQPKPEPAPEQPKPASERAAEATPDAHTLEAKPRDVGLVAQLAATGALGPLPGFGAGLFASMGVRARATRVEVVGNVGFPRTLRLDDRGGVDRPDAGVRVHYWSLGLRGCGEPTIARVSLAFPLCLGTELGPLTALGFGLDQNRRSSARWLAVVGNAGLSWAPTRVFGVFLAAEGWIGVARPRTGVEGVGVVHRPNQVGVRVRAGVEFRWPNNIGGRRPR